VKEIRKVQTADKERILIVDDEESITEISREVLERQGYGVFTASYGHEAIAIYSETTPPINLVILDINLPDMKGEEVLNCLRDINPHVKIILSSGNLLTGKNNAADGESACQFLQKPFRITELIKKVRDVLDAK
jgi:DNA-binding NtrC family response regulator